MKVWLGVNCTYYAKVQVDLPEDVVEQLEDTVYVKEGTPLSELMADTIHENDALDWEYEVVDIERIK